MERNLGELIDKFNDQEFLHTHSGRKGIENLCILARAIGYQDHQYWGQMSNRASIGDLVCFLEDNPGAIQAIHEWIAAQNTPEWVEALEGELDSGDDGQPSEEQEWHDFNPDC